jgi:hypothetical protein
VRIKYYEGYYINMGKSHTVQLYFLFGPDMEGVTGNCIMSSFIICTAAKYYWDMIVSRGMRWAEVAAHMEQNRSEQAYKILGRNPEMKRPFGRSGRRWKDIKVDL